jgi:hypothetical protein
VRTRANTHTHTHTHTHTQSFVAVGYICSDRLSSSTSAPARAMVHSYAELKAEHDALLEIHGTVSSELGDTASKLGELQAAHALLRSRSDSHAGASTDSLKSYKDMVEVGAPFLSYECSSLITRTVI